MPIVRSRLCVEGLNVCYCGGAVLEKELNSLLLKDNVKNQELLQRTHNRIPKNFPSHVLEDIKTRVLMTLQKPQKDEYFNTEGGVERMKAKMHVLGNGKTFKEELPYLQLSFFTRSTVTEVCFGDIKEEQPKLAYSIC